MFKGWNRVTDQAGIGTKDLYEGMGNQNNDSPHNSGISKYQKTHDAAGFLDARWTSGTIVVTDDGG